MRYAFKVMKKGQPARTIRVEGHSRGEARKHVERVYPAAKVIDQKAG